MNRFQKSVVTAVVACLGLGSVASQAKAAAVSVPVYRSDDGEVTSATLTCSRTITGGTKANVNLALPNEMSVNGVDVTFTPSGGLPTRVFKQISFPYEADARFLRSADRMYVRGAFLGSLNGVSLRFELPDEFSVGCD